MSSLLGRPDSSVDAFKLTYIQYDASSKVATLMAYATLLPILQLHTYHVLILYTRELTIVNLYMGQLVNECVNLVLKDVIKQPRPPTANGDELGQGFGMPSSHAQFVGYLACFVALHLERRSMVTRKGSGGSDSNIGAISRITLTRRVYQVALATSAAMVTYSRLYLGYHTSNQVMVGLTLGIVIGGLYYIITEEILRQVLPLRDVLLASKIAKWCRLKDSWDNVVENTSVLDLEYDQWAEKRAKHRNDEVTKESRREETLKKR